jgi:hypothetical protein
MNQVSKNFIFGTYSPLLDVDTDDGASYYDVHDNVLAYGGYGSKGAFGGHDIRHYRNFYYWLPRATYSGAHGPAWSNANGWFMNNTVVLSGVADPCGVAGGYSSDCAGGAVGMKYGFNRILTHDLNMKVCGSATLPEWVSKGHDTGSTIGPLPPLAEVISTANNVLGTK